MSSKADRAVRSLRGLLDLDIAHRVASWVFFGIAPRNLSCRTTLVASSLSTMREKRGCGNVGSLVSSLCDRTEQAGGDA